MTLPTIRVAGVPEHFNLPWRDIAASGLMHRLQFELDWQEIPEGTGAMIDSLENGSIDMALLLTEGAVAGIGNGRGYRIIGEYAATPLRWGIHTAGNRPPAALNTMTDKKFAISRFGSGSHLMAALLARDHGWAGNPEYVVVDHFDGARRALSEGTADLFLWEQFTTQPFVDSGDFHRIGIYPTPWPAFVACLSDRSSLSVATARSALGLALSVANLSRQSDHFAKRISAEYGMTENQAAEWLSLTRWSDTGLLKPKWITTASQSLVAAGTLERRVRPDEALAA